MSNSVSRFLAELGREPPFRIFTRAAIKRFGSLRAREEWAVAQRPNYLSGLLKAADEAKAEGVSEIAAIEFGVAAGHGLLAIQRYAAEVEADTQVRIRVYGFDAGSGLPALCGDYRDHPDWWRSADYPMDEAWLRSQLSERTTLIIGDVRDTVPKFVRNQKEPVGFVSFDLDLYSSTMDAFGLFTLPGRKMLRRVPLYFDDINFFFNHDFAGERLAIDEFNMRSSTVKIAKWRGVSNNRPFPEQSWLKAMYVAHDIEAISGVTLSRTPAVRIT
jgi:hypothetical protein